MIRWPPNDFVFGTFVISSFVIRKVDLYRLGSPFLTFLNSPLPSILFSIRISNFM